MKGYNKTFRSLSLKNAPSDSFGFLYLSDGGGGSAPTNNTPPSISGTAVVGQTLSSTTGTWTGIPTPTYSYQWYRGATLISGATNNTYTLVQDDAGNTSNIKCVVTATNSAGSASADSNTVATIFDATAWSYIQAANITDSTQRQAANFEMYTLKAGGVTSGYLGLYPLIGGTSAFHKWNMFNAVDSDAAKRLVFSGTITHDSNGMQGNGTNGVADTFINPSIDSTNDFTMWHYSRTATTSTSNRCDAGIITGGSNPGVYMGMQTHATGGTAVNSNINTGVGALANVSGLFIVKRVGNTITVKRNDVVIQTYTAPNLSLQNGKIRLMASMLLPASFINYSNKQYTDFGFLNIGTSDAQDTAIFNAVVGKETILGRNV